MVLYFGYLVDFRYFVAMDFDMDMMIRLRKRAAISLENVN